MISFQYKVFFEVASHLSFSKAADILYISQPAISKHIKKLEAEISVQLFERNGNSISLTSSGKKLLVQMHKAKQLENEIFSDIEIVKNQFAARGELKVGASTTVSLYVLPKILSAFHRKFPNIKILLINRNSENVLKALTNHEIDIAIIETRYEINAVQYFSFMQDEIIPVCAVHSPYAGTRIELKDLKDIPLAMRERGSGTLSVVSKMLEENKIKLADLNIIARLGGTEALKNYLLADIAVGFLSRIAVDKELINNTMKEVHLNTRKIKRQFNFVMRKGEERIGLVKEFINASKNHYNK